MHENRTEGCTESAVNFAAQNGHLNVVQFLLKNRAEGGTNAALDLACAAGKLDVVRYLVYCNYKGEYPVEAAAIGARVNVVEYLLANGFTYTKRAVDVALFWNNDELASIFLEEYPRLLINEVGDEPLDSYFEDDGEEEEEDDEDEDDEEIVRVL